LNLLVDASLPLGLSHYGNLIRDLTQQANFNGVVFHV
jgi:hypothetical protein